MGPDATNLAASLAKLLAAERSSNAVQRVSEIEQDQLADEAFAELHHNAPDAATQARREKLKQDHERRRREMERRLAHSEPDQTEDNSPGLDVVA